MPACYSHWRDLQCVDPANASDVGWKARSSGFIVTRLRVQATTRRSQPACPVDGRGSAIPGCQKGMPYHTRLASQRFRAAPTRTRDALTGT